MNPLVVIPARGGSKGIPGKNFKLLGGKPLVQYAVDAAREVFRDEIICVSTDCVEIKSIVEGLGLIVPFLRPAELATDVSGSYEVILHAIDFYENNNYFPDTLILLQPTSPFRNGKHISEALDLFDDNCEMVISVKETKSNPYYVLMEENEEGWLVKSKNGNYIRRQDCPKVFEVNGAIYIMHVEIIKNKPIGQLKKVRKYLMDEISSHDLDTMMDWIVAEQIITYENK